jgi:hypothetical protein
MDKEVVEHRTFIDPWAIYGGHVPVWIGPQQMAGDKGVHAAYAIRDKHLVQILIKEKRDQNFWSYATAWELEWSKLVFASNSATPFVDENMTVVAYCDWFEETSIFVPVGVTLTLDGMLKNGYDVFVAKRSPSPKHRALTLSERSWLLLVGIHGNVLFSYGLKNKGYVQASWVTPYDLWVGVKLVVSLAGSLRGKIVATLASKSGRSLVAGLFRELTEEELSAARGAGQAPGRTLVVGRGATSTRSTIPDVGTPETMGPSTWKPNYPTMLQDALQKFPQLRGQFGDAFIERIGINPKPASEAGAMGLTPGGVKAARDLLRPGGTLRILQNPIGGATLDTLENDIRSMISKDFTITNVERHPDGLLITAKKN